MGTFAESLPMVLLTCALAAAVGCKGGSQPDRAATSAAAGATKERQKPYAVSVQAPAQSKIGGATATTVTLEPRGGYKVNLEYPLKLTVRGPATARPATQELRKADAKELSDKRATMQVACSVTEPGEHRFEGKLRFSVCTETLCEVYAEDLSWQVRAK